MSIFLIFYAYYYFDCHLVFLIIEYVIYYVVYLIAKKRKASEIGLSMVLMAILTVFYTLFLCFHTYGADSVIEETIRLVFTLSVQFLTGSACVILLNRGEDILKFHMTLKELENEKQIKSSLFKITHEIKNPIAVCKGYLDMFNVNNIDHSRKYVPILREEIDRTLILLEDFLCMTKITVDKDLLDVNMLLEDVFASFKPMLKSKGMKYKLELLDNDVEIMGDYNRLVQVFFNILKNSLEAMTPSRGQITVYLEDNENNVQLFFEDNGSGISNEDMKRIREPFFTTKQKGTGLGVSLSYEIIEAHGGKVEYISEVKNGTTVIVTLPKR